MKLGKLLKDEAKARQEFNLARAQVLVSSKLLREAKLAANKAKAQLKKSKRESKRSRKETKKARRQAAVDLDQLRKTQKALRKIEKRIAKAGAQSPSKRPNVSTNASVSRRRRANKPNVEAKAGAKIRAQSDAPGEHRITPRPKASGANAARPYGTLSLG